MPSSMASQGLYLQVETVAGTAVTAAMKRVLGLKGTPGWTVEGEDFKASGYKVNTARTITTESSTLSMEAVQDYNAFLWSLAGAFGKPTSALVPTATNAYKHTFTLLAEAPDTMVTFTVMWGDSAQAVQITHAVFQSLELTINRGGLSMSTSMIGRVPTTGIALPGTGVTKVPSIPVGTRDWDFYLDPTWASLGTTKLLQAYEGGVTFGDKYGMDYVVNSAQPSFTSLIENDDTEYSGNIKVGFDATALAQIPKYTNGSLVYLQFKATGPIIEAAIPYSLKVNVCGRITSPTEFAPAPNSSSRTLPFEFQLTPDPVTGNVAEAELVNTVAALA